MFEYINEELIAAKEKMWRKEKFEGMIRHTEEALEKEVNRKIELEKALKDEDKDVKSLNP